MRVVVSYIQPDLDGTSCMYAYAELLNKMGTKASYYIWGEPKKEVGIVCKMFGIKLAGIDELKENYEYIAVDLNGIDQMHDIVNANNLVEIIDHHSISRHIPEYVNIQRVQIDKLGAAATIVAERFRSNGITPSREAAILLYYGIVSNSINFKAKITSTRDIEIAKWLKEQYIEISEEKISDIFEQKSKIDDCDLRREMECEIPLTVGKKAIFIGQLEIANFDEFLTKKNDKLISILKQIKNENNPDYIYINCIDILKGVTWILTIDDDSSNMIKDIFGIEINNGIGKADRIIQRKDMTKRLREEENRWKV